MSKFNSQTLSQITLLSKLYQSCMEDLIRKEFNWKQRHGKTRCRVCRSHWGYVDTNLLNVVNNKQATKKYQLIDPKTGDVQVALQAGRPT
jgi:hypothetical protein